jgi:hypothetical protein
MDRCSDRWLRISRYVVRDPLACLTESKRVLSRRGVSDFCREAAIHNSPGL